LAGRINRNIATFEGEVTYNRETSDGGKFLLPKLVDYIEQGDAHAATLTVKETLEFAWKSTTGGHHSYGFAKDEETAALMNTDDESLNKVAF
jgi:ABC-type multidrug transport system ATPase subunit